MELLGRNNTPDNGVADEPLYRALMCGDLPAAYIICKDIKQPNNPAASFNCGLCMWLLDEWEKSLTYLKRAEKAYANRAEYDIADRRLYLKAFETAGEAESYMPLDPAAPEKCGRHYLIRTRWLMARCLHKLGRESEAAPIIRFLSQYNIQLNF
ncbi:MAG: hypothetical protein HFK09_04335 [Clostridia bacterium]|nr:hypothetical protein [Clostridia bacterium]